MMLVCASLLKTGSTWWIHLVNEFLGQHGGASTEAVRQRYRLGRVIRGAEFRIGSLPPHKVLAVAPAAFRSAPFSVKTHAPATVSYGLANRAGLMEATFNVRDPRDQAVSVLDHARVRGEFSGGLLREVQTLNDAIDFVASQEPTWRSWMRRGATVVRYEDLNEDPAAQVQRLGDLLGIPISAAAAQEVVDAVNRRIAEGATRTKKNVGGSGRHVEAMTDEERTYAETRLGPMIEAMGYR